MAQGFGKNGSKPLLLVLKALVSGGLLYLVLQKAGPQRVLQQLLGLKPWALLLAMGLYLLGQGISSVRWRLFMPPQAPSVGRLYGLYLVGTFFNTVLPGLVGGDVVKTYYLRRHFGGELPQAVASVFMERYVGFAVLLGMGLLAYPFVLGTLRGSGLLWLLPLVAMLFAGGSLLVFSLRLGSRLAPLGSFYQVVGGFKARTILLAAALSVLVQALSILGVWSLSRGLGLQLPLLPFFAFIPVAVALSALPVSISGMGVREATFVLLFGALGVAPQEATALSFAWLLAMAGVGLLGLVEYLRLRA